MPTIKPYSSPAHQLKLESAFVITDNINVSFQRKGSNPTNPDGTAGLPFVPIKSFSANVTVYASEAAYTTNAQPIHNRNVSGTVGIDATFDDIDAAIVVELQKVK